MVHLSSVMVEGEEIDTTPVDEEQVSNGAANLISTEVPYVADITLRGVARLLMHAWNVEAVEQKANAPKNSAAKKTDDLESYVYRTPEGYLGVPGSAFKAAIVAAGRSMQDPRSPRKSAMDLLRAIVQPLQITAPFLPERTMYDVVDAQRVVVQRAAVTRKRPALEPGWEIMFRVLVASPEYLSPEQLLKLANQAGGLVGLCDFRPTYGRFQVSGFKVLPYE